MSNKKPKKLVYNNLSLKLLEASKKISMIEKNGFNNHQGYKYATGEDITRAFKCVFNELGIFTLIEYKDYNRVEIKDGKAFFVNIKANITFIDVESGEERTISGYGDGVDSLDKALYKAKTGALKYLLLKTFLIPTGDDDTEKDTELDKKYYKKQKVKNESEDMKNSKATPAQKDYIINLCAQHSLDRTDAAQLLKDNFNVYKISELSKKQISEFIEILLKLPKNYKSRTSKIQQKQKYNENEDVPF